MVDVIGIVVSINLSNTIMRKNGIETHKRILQIKDRSGHSVEITMWGSFCRNPTLAKCGGEAQHLEKVRSWSPPGLPNV
jgi:hypothetical protein